MAGCVIFLNGASSAGKSTLARALQARLELPFWHLSIDHLRDSGVLPMARIRDGTFDWTEMRGGFFAGFHRCLPVLAEAGNNLIVEHIVETPTWMDELAGLLGHLDVFFVGVHCPLAELERREQARGDRPPGDAKADFETVHRHCTYDFEIDGTLDAAAGADAVIAAWRDRTAPSAMARLRARG